MDETLDIVLVDDNVAKLFAQYFSSMDCLGIELLIFFYMFLLTSFCINYFEYGVLKTVVRLTYLKLSYLLDLNSIPSFIFNFC